MDSVWRALAHPIRRDIIALVRKDSLSAGEIASHFALTRPAISQHLTVLRSAGVLLERRDGTKRLYSPGHEQLQAAADWLEQALEPSALEPSALEPSASPQRASPKRTPPRAAQRTPSISEQRARSARGPAATSKANAPARGPDDRAGPRPTPARTAPGWSSTPPLESLTSSSSSVSSVAGRASAANAAASFTIQVDARPAVVWRLVTEQRARERWKAGPAPVVTQSNADQRTLAMDWRWRPSEELAQVEMALHPSGTGTQVDVSHSGPEPDLWETYLDRLQCVGRGWDPGPEPI